MTSCISWERPYTFKMHIFFHNNVRITVKSREKKNKKWFNWFDLILSECAGSIGLMAIPNVAKKRPNIVYEIRCVDENDSNVELLVYLTFQFLLGLVCL